MKYKNVLCLYPYKQELKSVGFLPPIGLEYISSSIEAMVDTIKVIDLLLSHGVEVDQRDSAGSTALLHAVFSESYKTVQHLIQCNSDVNVINKVGQTALSIAVKRKLYSIFKILISHGAIVYSEEKKLSLIDSEGVDTGQADNSSSSNQRSKQPTKIKNRLREFRIEQMMSKAELARKAGLSVLTIDRIEKGFGCRMDTKRKILKALGLKLSDREKLFQEE